MQAAHCTLPWIGGFGILPCAWEKPLPDKSPPLGPKPGERGPRPNSRDHKIMTYKPEDISDDVCLAALRGWCNAPPDFQFSPYQQSEETKAAWRRAIIAALNALQAKP